MPCTSTPVNKKLYNRIKNKVKARSKVWPSAYASGQLVREYKSKGGKYRCAFGSLDRWFKEKWVNVCKPKAGGGYSMCGRSKSSKKGYPYCRPLKRVNAQTPKTVGEIGKAKLRKMCQRKRKNPYARVFLNSFGIKNKVNVYTMNKEPQTCGYGRRRKSYFGNTNFDTFYEPGTPDSSHLTNRINKCNLIYKQPSVSRFGKKGFIQSAFKSFEKKGTKGAFTRWCKSHGYPKVTNACIARGKRSKNKRTFKRAIFAQNIRSRKKVYSFGDCGCSKNNLGFGKRSQKSIETDIRYLNTL